MACRGGAPCPAMVDAVTVVASSKRPSLVLLPRAPFFPRYRFFTCSPWITSKMAYNREWDKGKQADYGWQAPPRGNHTRDEDFYGDSKRRKYNDGVCSRFPVSGALLSKPFASGLRRVSRVRRFRMG